MGSKRSRSHTARSRRGRKVTSEAADKPQNQIPIQLTVRDEVPGSIRYLHGLASRGLADRYDWEAGTASILIAEADARREPSLRGVEVVMLRYAHTPKEEDTEDE